MGLLRNREGYRFTNRDLIKIIIPLVIEQFLAISVGMADSVMVSNIGEAAISSVSLMDNIFILIINIFAALATGGCVIASQFIGKNEDENACKVSDQLLLFVTVSSIVIMGLVYLGQHFIINVVFGKLKPDVVKNCYIYLYIVTASIPFLSIYNAGAAIFRAMGDSKTPMKVSLTMSLMNIAGNAILLYGFKRGVEGAAIPTLISRIFAAAVIYILLRNENYELHFSKKPVYKFNKKLLKKILYVGIPASLENSLFQLGKILVLGMISSFGTAAIAANSIGNIFAALQNLPGIAMNYAVVIVVARCFGAGEYDQVKYYTKKMILMMRIATAVTVAVMVAALPSMLNIYNVSRSAKEMAYLVTVYHGICLLVIWPESFALPNALRACYDVKFCMWVGILSMWFCRIVMSYVLGVTFEMGLFGVWIAMTLDWLVRGILMSFRFYRNKWMPKGVTMKE